MLKKRGKTMSILQTKSKEQIKQLRARAEQCTIRNDREGYDNFWADDELVDLYLEPARVANFRLVAQMCADWSGDVIDMGCGCGTMLQELLAADRTGRKKLTGVDYAASSIQRCKTLLSDATLIQSDLCRTGLPDASFDLVLSIQTMEHLDDAKKAFTQMWRLMKVGAHLIVTIPNGEIDDWEGHHNFWTIDSFLKMAEKPAQSVQRFNEDRNLLFLFRKQN
jgi:trans-aconitate methyltransferase